MLNQGVFEFRKQYEELKIKRTNLEELKNEINELAENESVKKYLELICLSKMSIDSREFMEMAFLKAGLKSYDKIYFRYGFHNNNLGFLTFCHFADDRAIYRNLASSDDTKLIEVLYDKEFQKNNYVIIPERVYSEESSYRLYQDLQKWYYEQLLTTDSNTSEIFENIKQKTKKYYPNI